MTGFRFFSLAAVPASLLALPFTHAEEAPEKALKYHEALLKRPHNAALFDRFFGAWLDEQPVESLGAFLKARAEANGGLDWSVLATYELRRGNEENALAALAKAIETVADDPALPMERGKLRLRRLEFDLARADLAKVAAGKDEVLALEAAKLIGKSWLREGRTEEAIKAWDAVLAAHPGDEDLLEDLVETAAAESETAQALVYADKLVAASKDPYQKTLRMLRRGDLLAQAGKNDDAVSAYVATLEQVGEGSWLEREVLAQIEKLYRKQDRLDDLSGQLKKLAEAYPRRLLIHRQLAKLEAAQGETDAAIGRFREVLKRSPGERELREEFVRLLTDGERFDDAVAELDKLIELAPTESGLYLQVAALRFRQGKPEAVLAALGKAHELLGKDEGSGIRIASLMLQYNLNEPGESLLKQLSAAEGAGPVALETLAAQYGKTNRKAEAIELLKKAGAGAEVDVLLRTTGSISALGESAIAYETLTARAGNYPTEPRFLASLAQAALAAGKAPEAVPHVLKLVRLAKQAGELAEGISLASRVIAAAEKSEEVRTTLLAQASRTAAETCLLASLIEDSGDFVEVGKLLDPNTDPLVVHFHAALLDRRGEFDAAIAVLSRLADTEEGRKAAYFKDLSELQQRAGKTVEALATVERWKQTAPGDKTAWITGSRLLRESGKPEEAVKMTRQAVARFEGDADLAASLASLHDEAGQWADSEAIYWRLYDESQSPADQARWSVQLAQLAQRTGKISELEEKLRERARGNRRSIGPVLAQAELARVTNNDNKRRDLLMEAVRLQPKDVDLRLQIANLEEQSGNPDRVLAVLEEAMPYDVNGRVRSALAQAYLRQGQTLKGMRELRMLAGKSGFDVRSAESAAASLAGTKLYDEAINLLRAELPDGGDWRSRYLLAVMLEEDGRETEALPLFLGLLQAQGDVPGLTPPGPSAPNRMAQYSKEASAINDLMAASQAAYAHRNGNSGYSYSRYSRQAGAPTGPFNLPNKVEDVRQFSLIHLCAMSRKKTGEVDESIRSQIKAAGVENAAFISDLTTLSQGSQRGNPAKLLESYADQPGFYEWMISYGGMYGSSGGIDEAITRRVLEHGDKLSQTGRFMAWASLCAKVKPEDPAWSSMLDAAKSGIEDKSGQSCQFIMSRLMEFLRVEQGGVPEKLKPRAKQLLLAVQKRLNDENPENAHTQNDLYIASLAGSPEAWLVELNAVIRDARKNTARPTRSSRSRLGQLMQYSSMRSYGSYNPWSDSGNLFALPTLETIPVRSIPMEVLLIFKEGSENRSYYSYKPSMSVADLLKVPDKIESPFLRAWLAVVAGDKTMITRTMAVTPPNEEACDFQMLRALIAIQDKKLKDAFNALLAARAAAGSDRETSGSINVSLIAIAGEMTPEERKAVAEDLQATFLQCRQVFGLQGAPVLGAQARKLGLEELAKRIEPAGLVGKSGGPATGPAAIASASMSGSSRSAQGGSPEKVRKFVIEKKFEAAAREVLQGVRGAGAQNSPYYFNNELPQLLAMLGKDGQAELLKLVEPGESKSLVKRLEYVDICQAMGKPELTIPVLEALMKERPDDATISARLVFVLPEDQTDRRIELLTKACKAEAFVAQAHQMASKLGNKNDTKVSMAFFEMVTRWLETADPKSLSEANLTWVSYHAKLFFEGSYTSNLQSPLSSTEEPKEDKEAFEKFRVQCDRLARAMVRHASCAEEGFRLLNATKFKRVEPTELDELARKALLATAAQPTNDQTSRYSSPQFFMFISNGGSSSSGDVYQDSSSAMWLTKRLNDVKISPGILTPEFVAAMKERNPDAAVMIGDFNRELKNEDLEVLWKSGIMKSSGSRFSQMLRPVLMKRLSAAPGATKFFIEKIMAIAPGAAVSPSFGGDRENMLPLFVNALSSAAGGKPGDLDEVAKAIKRAVFGEKLDFSDPKSQQLSYQRVNFMENLTQEFSGDVAAMMRYQAAFFRMGVPVDDDEYGAIRPFQNKRFSKPEEAEAFLESIGWLSDLDDWNPYACMLYRTSSSPTGVQVTIQPALVMERALQYLSYGGMETSDLVKKLKDRKKGRFGSLMVAAALSSGNDRSKLAGQAFTEFSAGLSKLSPERMESFSMVLPWLPEDVRGKLPEVFRRKLDAADAKKRKEAFAVADQFLASLKTQGVSNGMDSLGTVLAALIPYDLDRAVEVFVAADQEFTNSLNRGGRFSSSSNNDFQISERDEALGRVMQSYNEGSGPFGSNPKLKLKFLSKIIASPSGKRLVYMDPNYSDQTMFARAALPLLKDVNNSGSYGDRLVRTVEVFKSLEPELKPVAMACFLIPDSDSGRLEAKERKEVLTRLAKVVDKDSQAARLATVRLALMSWKACTPEEKAEARQAITALISDNGVFEGARVIFAAKCLGVLPKEELLDAPMSAAIVKLYQDYCAGERSSVSQASAWLFNALVKSPLRTEAAIGLHAALATAFWDNAAAAKPAGHPVIPASLAQSAFIVTLLGKDSAQVSKVFPRIKAGLSGKLMPMLSLMQIGQVDLAKQLIPAPGEAFIIESNNLPYTSELEGSIEALRKAGVDPLSLMKLEVELLAFELGKNAEAPKEALEDRVKRLVEAFVATPPQGEVFPLSMVALMDKAPGNEKLRTLAEKWVKDNPVDGFMIRDNQSGSRTQERGRQAAVNLHGTVAVHAFGAGDATFLDAIGKAIDLPTNNGGNYYLIQSVMQMMRAMSRTVWIDVCTGDTTGYKKGLPVWNDFFIKYATLTANYDSSEVRNSLALTQFLACWAGDPEAMNSVVEKMPEKTKPYLKSFNRQGGIMTFIEGYRYRGSLDTLPATAGREIFLEKALSQPGFASSLTTQVGWVNTLVDQLDCKAAVDVIAAKMPPTLIPESLPALYEYQGRALQEKDIEQAQAATRKGLELTPAGAPWNDTRGMMKWQLADQLLAGKKPDQAKEVFLTIKPEEIASWLKDRYKKTAAALGVPELKKETPPPASPKP